MHSEYHIQLVRLLAHIDQRMAAICALPIERGDSECLQRIAIAYCELEKARHGVEATLGTSQNSVRRNLAD